MNSGSFRSIPLARKFLLSTCLERHLLSLRSSSMLNLSVLQDLSPSFYSLYCLSSSPCPPPLFLRLPLCRLLYVHQHLTLRQLSLSSSVFRGQWSFVSSPVYRSVLSALYHGNIPFHLPVCVGGPERIAGTLFNYLSA